MPCLLAGILSSFADFALDFKKNFFFKQILGKQYDSKAAGATHDGQALDGVPSYPVRFSRLRRECPVLACGFSSFAEISVAEVTGTLYPQSGWFPSSS